MMIYVALLRGINVGGNNKIDMKLLITSFESVGMENVQKYINTGNIIFSSKNGNSEKLARILEDVIKQDFDLQIPVLIRTVFEMEQVINNLPQEWQNNSEMKSDVLFLWHEIDNNNIIEKIHPHEDIDTVTYIPGTLLWTIDRKYLGKSAINKIASTSLYRQMTIRNVNTTRKIYSIMKERLL